MNADILIERFGTDRVIIKCAEFDETVQATNRLQEIGFKHTDNSKSIASGEKVYAWGDKFKYWKHPFTTSGVIHYYNSEFEFVFGDYDKEEMAGIKPSYRLATDELNVSANPLYFAWLNAQSYCD